MTETPPTSDGASPPPPPTTPPSETSSPGSGSSQDLPAFVPAIVSLVAPGLGLLLLKSRDRVKDAIAIFGGFFVYVSIATILTTIVIGICCWFPVPLLNLAAAVHSYDEATLLEGGSPLIFKNGFRLFKD